MKLDPLHPRVTEIYHNLPTRNLIVVDALYESYLNKKREMQRQMNNSGRRVISHFSMNEEDMTLFEMFDDGETDSELFSERENVE